MSAVSSVALHRFWRGLLTLIGLIALALPALAADDPPGRVGLIAWIDGSARLQRGDGGDPIDHDRESLRNWPLTSGDLLSVGERSRAELGIGSTRLRLNGGAQLLLRRVDDGAIELQLLRGSLALALRNPDVARELLIDTPAARHRPLGSGEFRFDAGTPWREGQSASAWRGDLRIEQRDGSFVLRGGQRAELYGDGGWRPTRLESDEFARWALMGDDAPYAAGGDLPPEMTGADRLASHGDWERSADWGWIWLPRAVALGWAPYRDGRWIWVEPWGWTWVDVAPWGFAPFHYGRWVQVRERWAWVPGEYRQGRPVYAPALVGWSAAPGVSVSVRIGPGVFWFPLAPREVYLPGYRCTPEHLQRLNRAVVGELRHPERLLERPDEHWRDARHPHERSDAVSTIEDRGGREWRIAPWRNATLREGLPALPRVRAPEPPSLRLPLPWSSAASRDDGRRNEGRNEGRNDRRDERRSDRNDRPDRTDRVIPTPAPTPPAPGRPGDASQRQPERRERERDPAVPAPPKQVILPAIPLPESRSGRPVSPPAPAAPPVTAPPPAPAVAPSPAAQPVQPARPEPRTHDQRRDAAPAATPTTPSTQPPAPAPQAGRPGARDDAKTEKPRRTPAEPAAAERGNDRGNDRNSDRNGDRGDEAGRKRIER